MTKTSSVLFLILSSVFVLVFGGNACASVVWIDNTTGNNANFGDEEKYTMDLDSALSSAGAGSYQFAISFTTKGNPWEDSAAAGDVEYYYMQILKGSTVVASTVYDDISGNNVDVVKTLNFDYLADSDDYSLVVFVDINAGEVTTNNANSEKWQFNDARIASTPIPSALLLMGSGLFGLIGVRCSRAASLVP